MTRLQPNQSARPPVTLDTSVASLFLSTRADNSGYSEIAERYRLLLPTVAYGELEQGALIDGWGRTGRLRLQRFLDRVTLLPVTKSTAELWASLRFECRRRGIGNTENDAWIAATALEMDCPLVSHDRDHLRMQAAVPQLQVLSLLTP